ncbi:MAG: YtxH domain-containing protein [Gemmatimonadaceae bacterium]
MSYAGPSRGTPPRTSSKSQQDHHETDWQQVALFGAGLALGIALGAGVAMLTAPQSGEETRADIRRFAVRRRKMIGRRSQEAWMDLRSELRGARQAIRRRRALRAADQEAEAYSG